MKTFPRTAGFTLVEMLLVLLIAGLLAGLAVPRLSLMLQRFEIASQRKQILSDIEGLGYRAYVAGRPLVLSGEPAPDQPLALPAGWTLKIPAPIRYAENGVCFGGKLTLISPDGLEEAFRLESPRCRPLPGAGS